jgi:hypothetical protein
MNKKFFFDYKRLIYLFLKYVKRLNGTMKAESNNRNFD